MPPVRWKPRKVAAVICILQAVILTCSSAQLMQEAISMTSDGWRPIIGNVRNEHQPQPPITSYHDQFNTNGDDLYQTQTVPPTTTTPSPPPHKKPQNTPPRNKPPNQLNNKKLLTLNPFFGLTAHGSHAPHIPLGAVSHGRPGQSGQLKKYPHKPFTNQNKQRKPPPPLRVTNHGNREEMFAPYFNKGSNKVKTRETTGLGLPGHHYQISQPHAHIEFNRFAPDAFHYTNPTQGFIFPKHHLNEVTANFHADDFTRNLVPPPPLRPPHHDPKNPHKTEVLVTKEKLNTFNNYKPNYYDFQSSTPSPATYEVTEPKQWEETPPQYAPRRRKPFLPTPYSDDPPMVPTSPTQAEVSTIFTKLSLRIKEQQPTPNPYDYSIKEVSTHFPVFGRPLFDQQTELEDNEVTTVAVRPMRRRRTRPTTTTTTTEEPPQLVEEPSSEEIVTKRPSRGRRPSHRYRTPSSTEPARRRRPLEPDTEETSTEELHKRTRYNEDTPLTTTTQKSEQETVVYTPENEIITSTEVIEETTTPTPTTTSTTTTTLAPSTTTRRIRGRPIKYDNSNRPRFSVKDYRQKLSSTTEAPPSSTRAPLRLRRPTTPAPENGRFAPKDPRHSSTTLEPIITEKNVKAVNTRLRPFGRYRTTVATSTPAPRVSIKPNLFSARKRPTLVSLRSRIMGRNRTSEATTTERVEETTVVEEEEATVMTTTEEAVATTTTIADVVKNESAIYSQRVSDLTSSSQNEYGVFKNVVAPTTSRRIPNYFTIATDDPILPIEAFFPNIKDNKTKER